MEHLIAPIIVLALLGLMYWFLGRFRTKKTTEQELYKNLLRKCMGDKAQAERLIGDE